MENLKIGILLFNEKIMFFYLYWIYVRKYLEVYIFFIMKIRKKSDVSCVIEIKFEKYFF